MKEFLERFGLADFFAYVCPGAIALCSFLVWLSPGGQTLKALELLGKQPILPPLLFLIIAYAIGLILNLFSSFGAASYIRDYEKLRAYRKRGILFRLSIRMVVVGLPQMPSGVGFVEAMLRMQELIGNYCGQHAIELIRTPWDFTMMYRTVLTDQIRQQNQAAVEAAQRTHHRFVYSLGVAVACLMVGIQCIVRWVWIRSGDGSSPSWLVIVGSLAFIMNIGLRYAARALWVEEFLLTSSIRHGNTPPPRIVPLGE